MLLINRQILTQGHTNYTYSLCAQTILDQRWWRKVVSFCH